MIFKKSVFAVASLLTVSCTLLSAGGASAQEKTSYVGLSLSSIGGTTFYGVNSKFKVADSISARPFFQFASASSGSTSATLSVYGASATYDFSLPSTQFAPYAGIGYLGASLSATGPGGSGSINLGSGIYFEAGTDYNITDSIALNANYKFKDNGYFSFGGAYRF
ncbi:outer membrane beta-barrel protein [Chamaesiphon sp. GL140_3_metabinner_50]|uniref:outer membrane beta-barrel protein n=1 Tax=Chamaesiphon sp. GL140_3_metabinner_50 TaxID=2970812 RepID=UPI0025DFB1DC|nr:outer membrane beta-barrel protein [Chamaesiphon sp. GL140_3_metabinner_50]